MGNACSGCKKQFGRFTNLIPLHENSSLVFCSACNWKFRTALNAVNANNTNADFDAMYQEYVSAVRTSGFPEDVRVQMVKEIEELHKDTLPERQKAVEERRNRQALGVEPDSLDYEYLDPSSYMMTTGYNFEGYSIKQYLGVVSDSVVQGTGWLSELSADFNDFFGTESNTFANKMEKCRDVALRKMCSKARKMGANAIIGISFETTTFRNNMVGIIATGTAVFVEKNNDSQQFSKE